MTFLSGISERVSVIIVGTYVLAMALLVLLLVSTSIGLDLLNHQGHLVLGAFLIPIYTPIEINLLAGFIGLLAIFTLCFFAAAKNNGGLLAGLRGFFVSSEKRNLPNWLVIMPLISSALVLIVVGLTFIQDSAGIPTGSLPQLENYQLLYILAYAPPLEETMFRISTIGLLVALRTLWASPKVQAIDTMGRPVDHHSIVHNIAMSFLSPETAKREAGLPSFNEAGWHSLHWTEWLLLLITSAGFGLAHILTGAGWELGKVVPAAVSGFVLGICYLMYGAYASILLHWFFNVYFEAFALGSDLLGGVFVTIEGIIGFLTFVTGALGIGSGIIWLSSRRNHPSETTYTIQGSSPVVTGEAALYHRQVD